MNDWFLPAIMDFRTVDKIVACKVLGPRARDHGLATRGGKVFKTSAHADTSLSLLGSEEAVCL